MDWLEESQAVWQRNLLQFCYLYFIAWAPIDWVEEP